MEAEHCEVQRGETEASKDFLVFSINSPLTSVMYRKLSTVRFNEARLRPAMTISEFL